MAREINQEKIGNSVMGRTIKHNENEVVTVWDQSGAMMSKLKSREQQRHGSSLFMATSVVQHMNNSSVNRLEAKPPTREYLPINGIESP